MSISLHIPGDPAALKSAAAWLDPSLRSAVLDADLEMAWMVGDATYLWTGESGYAFNSATQAVRRSAMPVPGYVKDTAEVLRAYAGRLERGADDFADDAAYARRQGLSVMGDTIQVPTTWLLYCPDPDGPESAELREWQAYQDRVNVYNDLSERVGTWWGELEVWVAEQFATLVADIEVLREADSVYERLVAGNEVVVGIALDASYLRTQRNVADFRQHLDELQAQADQFQRQLRSGNPAIRAAAEAADPRGMRQGIRVLNEMIDGVSRASRVIPVLGGAIDIVSAGAEIAAGGSPSSVGVGLLFGAGGGALVGAGIVVAGVSIPPLGVALLVGGAAVAVGEFSTWAWEAWVPLDDRESIDAGIRDFFGFINPASRFVDTP